MATGIGFPFQGRVYYWLESTFGGAVSGATLPVSCFIQDVRIGTGDRHKPIRDIGAAQVVELMKLAKNPTLHLEYNPQVGDTLIDDAVERTSCCTLPSYTFVVETNKCCAAADDSQWLIKGAKANTVRISGSKDEPWTVTIDFLCKSAVTNGAITAAPTPLAGAILTYNLAGSIVYSAGHSAFTTESVDITFNHNLHPYVDIGGTSPEFIVDGAEDITGSCDITLDGGGGIHFNEVQINTAFTLTLTMGAVAGSPIITIPGCEWDNSEIDKNVSGEWMIESAAWTAAPISCATEGVCLTTIVTASV